MGFATSHNPREGETLDVRREAPSPPPNYLGIFIASSAMTYVVVIGGILLFLLFELRGAFCMVVQMVLATMFLARVKGRKM